MDCSNGIRNWKFKNWAETYSCVPSLYFEPKSLNELKDILKNAEANKKKIRVVGCGHSPSAICCTNDFMVSLKHFNKILDIDTNNLRVKVEAGAVMENLNSILQDNNMAFSVLGSISDQTIGGAISTAYHGTGLNFTVISDYVTEIDMLLASGEVKSYNRQSEIFPALLCSLGCLGIILNVTIQCEPAFRLEQIEYGAKLEDILSSLDQNINSSDHFRAFWYPHTDNAICYHASRTNKEITKKPKNWFMDIFVGYYLLEFLYWIGTFVKSIIPLINRFYFRLAKERNVSCDISYKIFNFDCLFKQYAFECAIPKKETVYFLLKLKAWLENNPQVKIHFGVEIRFVKADKIWISPCYEQDSCYLNILMFKPYGKDYSREEWWKINEELMIECKGRPAWAKQHNLSKQDLIELYPKFSDFDQLRRQLDPNNMFMNEFLEKFFN